MRAVIFNPTGKNARVIVRVRGRKVADKKVRPGEAGVIELGGRG